MSAKGKSQIRNPQNTTKLRNVESLERLKDRVMAAADEIVRLRGENSRMASDITQLRASLADAEAHRGLALDEDPEELREKVKGFIEAIDEYLQTES